MPRFSNDPQTEQSLQHSLKDSAAFAAMTGAGETYISAFALFLGAGTAQIGVLASVPPVLASFVQLFSAWLGRALKRRKALIVFGASTQALTWIPLLALPLLFPDYAVELLIVCVVTYFAAANLAAPQWSGLIGDIVPRRKRGRFFGVRTQLITAVTFLSLVAGGGILHVLSERDQTLYGFITLFLAAAVARIISVYHLSRMHDPGAHPVEKQAPLNVEWWQRLKESNFARFSIFFALMQMAVSVSAPFFTVYLLRDLGVDYLEFTVVTATAILAQFLTLAQWGRISDVFGNRRILTVCGALLPSLPLMWLFSSEIWYLMAIQVVSGISWAGFNLSAGNFLYDLIQPNRRVRYMAFHNVLASIGIFFGALLGGTLGEWLPDTLRIGDLTWEWPSALEVRAVRPIGFGGVIFRVTGVNALAGLVFDVVGNLPRKREDD